MRTTIEIPENLCSEAQDLTGIRSKTDIILFSLHELIRRKKLEQLAALGGTIDFEIDIKELRQKYS